MLGCWAVVGLSGCCWAVLGRVGLYQCNPWRFALPWPPLQVKKVAVKKHGSISHIEAVKDRRADEKFEQQAQQRKRGPAAEAQRAKQDEEVGRTGRGGRGGSEKGSGGEEVGARRRGRG